jgi:chemotaxis signal transduction protein
MADNNQRVVETIEDEYSYITGVINLRGKVVPPLKKMNKMK